MTTENRQARNFNIVQTYKAFLSKGMRKSLAKEKVADKFDLTYVTVHRIISDSED